MMNLFYNEYEYFEYTNNGKDNKTLYCPLNVDTEFYSLHFTDTNYSKNPSPTLTVQVSDKDNKQPKIYTHQDSYEIARHDLLVLDFVAFQYLVENGYQIQISDNYNNPSVKLPTIIFDLYCHFAIAEIQRIFHGNIKDEVKKLIVDSKKSRGSKITSENRTRASYQQGFKVNDFAYLPYTLNYQNINYQVAIRIMDTIGIAGNRSYAKLSELSGTKLLYKDLLIQSQKENMKDTYLNNPQDFDNYALGDLQVYENILNLKQLFSIVTTDLNVSSELRMTVGSTTANLLSSKLSNHFGISDKKRINELLKYANGDYLRKCNDTRALLSKVDGGRCFNNRPTEFQVNKDGCDNLESIVTSESCLVDIDISGAYGKGLSYQDYPLGKPRMFQNRLDIENNSYPSLGQFLKKYGSQLVDGLWVMRVTSKGELRYSQDLISSWVISDKDLQNLAFENDNYEGDYTKKGYSRIFSHEIINGVVTSDILDIINNVASKFQRKELLDNLMVINCGWYSKQDYCDDIDEVLESIAKFEGESKSYYDGNKLISEVDDCHKWTKVNLGDLLINNLLMTRFNYKKLSKDNSLSEVERDKNNNLQDFYKLVINTTYGVIVSKFFNVGNTIVGNNITARCRCMAWLLEKGLNSFQTITDGGVFELDKVVYPVKTQRLTMSDVVKDGGYSVDKRNWTLKPLYINKWLRFNYGDGIYFNVSKVNPLDFNEGLDNTKYGEIWDKLRLDNEGVSFKELYNLFLDNIGDDCKVTYSIENDVLDHLRNIFKGVKLLHGKYKDCYGIEKTGCYSLEIKHIAKGGKFHGNANYKLESIYDISNLDNFRFEGDKYKMRGYKSDRSFSWDSESLSNENIDDNYVYESDFEKVDIIKSFLDNLGEIVPVQKPFIQNGIIKINEYRNNYKYYQNTNLIVGGTLYTVRLLRELSIGQFLYPDRKTFDKVYRKHNKHKQKYGYGYEGLFLNSDSYELNYGVLIKFMDESIRKGNDPRLKSVYHPYHSEWVKMGDLIHDNGIYDDTF